MALGTSVGKPRQSVISGPSQPALLHWTFNDLLRERLLHHPGNIAVISQHQNVTVSYAELARHAEQLAVALQSLGVKKDDRVGVLLGNRWEYAAIMFACSKLGAYFTLFNYAYTPSELLNALLATTPKVLLTTLKTSRFNYVPVLEQLDQSLPDLRRIVVLDECSAPISGSVAKETFVTYGELLEQSRGKSFVLAGPANVVKDSDILNLQFTSGSTGLPKTAALTHHGMLNSARYIGLQMKIKPSDRINVPVPLFHAFGLVIGLCAAFMYGGAIVLPSEYFDAGETLQAVEKYHCTGLYGVTTMFVDMLSHRTFESTNRSSLKFGLMAGSAMPNGLLSRVINKFPIKDVYTNWGMTELSSIATMTTAEDPIEKKLQSAGRLLPGFVAKIIDSNCRVVPWGQRGEIVVSGFGVMHSYYDQLERTIQAIRHHEEDDAIFGKQAGNLQSQRRWMHTGDEGFLDQDGYFVITGRIKDLIIRGGENISPLEIEARLYNHPWIKQCAVFGVPSPRYGEEVAAILELDDKADRRPSDAEIRTWVRKELSRYKAPVYIWWLGDSGVGIPDEWPKTANGKLKKGDIKKIGEDLLSRGHATLPSIQASL